MRSLFIFFCLGLVFVTPSAKEQTNLIVAVPDTLSNTYDSQEIGELIDSLNKKISPYHLVEKVFVEADAQSQLERLHPAFVIGSAGFESQFATDSELKPFRIATRKNYLAKDPKHSVGALIITLKNRNDLNTIDNLKGKRVASTLPNTTTWFATLGELNKHGFDPDNFFSKIDFVNDVYPDVISRVLSGNADAAIIPTCLLDNLINEGLVDASELKVVNQKNDNLSRCLHSTELYPDLSFMGFEWTSPTATRQILLALLTPKQDGGFEWLVSVPHQHMVALLRELKIGPFAYLRLTTIEGFIARYKQEILLAVLLIFLLLINELRVHRLVRKRTKELRLSLAAKTKMENEARRIRLQMGQLERRNIVNQLSAIVAHDIKNPLGVIVNYVAVLKYLLQRETQQSSEEITHAIEGIQNGALRIGEIVDKVRQYAKDKQKSHQPLNLVDVIHRAISHLKVTFPREINIELNCPQEAWISGDSLELELLIFNLLKNAVEAQSAYSVARLNVSLESTRISEDISVWRITIINQGDKLPKNFSETLNAFGSSRKAEGLGLGLSIVQAIADSHGARIRFVPRENGGLIVEVDFDALSKTYKKEYQHEPSR